ncbi:hypothetical protein ACFQX6_38150 [Streptosporangium lutulentum]
MVLDNVAGADQVRPLLPGAGPSVVLITSRNRLLGLEEVPPVSLDVLTPQESAELLARASGDPGGPDGRLARDAESAAEVLRLCGHLPLALRLAGARLRHRPGWTVGILVERMAEGTSEFDTAFAMSVRQLDRAERRLFRLLGLLFGSSFDEYVAAALADVPLRGARAMLEDLLDAHLVQQPSARPVHLARPGAPARAPSHLGAGFSGGAGAGAGPGARLLRTRGGLRRRRDAVRVRQPPGLRGGRLPNCRGSPTSTRLSAGTAPSTPT